MLYRTRHGKILDEEDLNQLDPYEIEEHGIYADDWHEDA